MMSNTVTNGTGNAEGNSFEQALEEILNDDIPSLDNNTVVHSGSSSPVLGSGRGYSQIPTAHPISLSNSGSSYSPMNVPPGALCDCMPALILFKDQLQPNGRG